MSNDVGHFVSNYLPITETFIYQYLTNHERYEPFVCGTFSENVDLFEFSPREIFMELPRWNPRFWTYGALAKLGVKDIRDTYYPRVLERRDPDIMHAHFGPMGVDLAPYQRDNRKLVTSFYGYDASRFVQQEADAREQYQTLFDQGDLVLVEGPAMAEKVEELGCPRSKIGIQRIAINTSRITPQYPDVDGGIRVLMVGRFVQKKGMPDGIKAFANAFKRNDAELRIVGGPGTYKQKQLQKIARDANIEDSVTFTGFLEYDDYLREVHECDLLLAPSKLADSGDSEGGAPTVLLEAQASGKPVVSTTHADIPYVVEDGETGILVEPGDVTALSEALTSCTADPEKMEEMGRAGVKRMAERHDIGVLAPKLEQRYDELR
ncbi:glycosyltransferase [Halobacterium litoreum]|uniref:Glycosyltransferase n=1 Tax=Halobacterium litoreum TaxID=2039234 RepID=A0ABD5NB20_9EURY|nr:glycosyltransferase [Halobacterium litoreum]UHH14724.1 glycosyltransferase [Halobacterium litoreum]